MKHLKLFQTEAEYTAYKDSEDFVTPNVSYTVDSSKTFYSAFEEIKTSQKAGDIVYYVDGNIKTVPYASYNASMGTAVGVIVIPEGFVPDGKARMVSLKFATSAGTSSDTSVALKWGPTATDTTLTNYNMVPTTDNVGSTTTGSKSYGYLPSDNFSGTASVIDPEAKYRSYTPYIVSPYLNDAANPDYYGAIEGYNNAFGDFNGSGNTATLVGLGSDYTVANAANNYSDGVSGAKWYLPAIGELGYLMPRFKEINKAITTAGGVALPSSGFWSSTENDRDEAYILGTKVGNVKDEPKLNTHYVRPFAIVEYPRETKLVCTYNVTDTTNSTKLCNNASNFTSMEVDGVLQDNVTTEYTFDTVGEHTVKFKLTDPTSIGSAPFNGCYNLTSITIPDSVTTIGGGAFINCTSLNEITCLAPTAPSISFSTFPNVKEGGILKVLTGSDYSSWMSTNANYLGYYNWTVEYI